MGGPRKRPDPAVFHAWLATRPHGAVMGEIRREFGLSRCPARLLIDECIAFGLPIVTVGEPPRVRYCTPAHQQAVGALVLDVPPYLRRKREAAKLRRHRQREARRREAAVAAEHDDWPVVRLFVAAGSVPPPACAGPRSVWQLGQAVGAA